jgi:hypothetical protein
VRCPKKGRTCNEEDHGSNHDNSNTPRRLCNSNIGADINIHSTASRCQNHSNPLPSSTTEPSATPTIGPANDACVRAATEIPEGQNPARFTTSGPAAGCYDSVGEFLDDIGLTWAEFVPRTEITFWTQWPLDSAGALIPPTPTPAPLSVSISPSMDDGFEYVCGHPPFTVDFKVRTSGGSGGLQYAWDFDGDGSADASAQDPEPTTYQTSGVYNATLTVTDRLGQLSVAERRIVVIGQPTWPAWKYGVTAHVNLSQGQYANMEEMDQALSMISGTGIEAVRVGFDWIVMQPEPRRFDWADYDRMVAAITRYNLGVLAIVMVTPQWAALTPDQSEFWLAPPSDMRTYARFVYELVNRYHESVQVWEFWNEPNVSIYWKPAPDPLRFAEMQRLGYLAAKYADPKCVVLLTGLANDLSEAMPQHMWYPPEQFLEAVYTQIGGGYFDAVGRHPYTHPTWEGLDVLIQRVEAIRVVMAANGDGSKPLWLDEMGHCLIGGLTEDGQAEWLTQVFDHMLSSTDYDAIFWYNFRNKPFESFGYEEGSEAYICERSHGLVRTDFTPKPAYYAYQDFIRQHPAP